MLAQPIQDPDRARVEHVVQALLQMTKLDIQKLRNTHEHA